MTFSFVFVSYSYIFVFSVFGYYIKIYMTLIAIDLAVPWPLKKLIFYARNTRTHDDTQLSQIHNAGL